MNEAVLSMPPAGGRSDRAPTPLERSRRYLADAPKRSIATIGRSALLGAEVIQCIVIDSVRLRFAVGETLVQAWALLKITSIPAVLMAIPFGAVVSVQVSGVVNQVGASSLVGAASGLGVIRQGAPIAAGLLMGGAAAAAIAADLGARMIREEVDAMKVMGVDPVRRLVAPRFLALVLIAPILCMIIIAAAVLASFVLAVAAYDVAAGSYWSSFGGFARVVDIWFAIARTVLFAMLVTVISALRGLEAKGGPRGVADAVNSSVVLSVIAVVIANLAVGQFEALFFPLEVA